MREARSEGREAVSLTRETVNKGRGEGRWREGGSEGSE